VPAPEPQQIPLRVVETRLAALIEAAVAPLRAQAEARDVAVVVELDEALPDSIAIDPEKIAWAIATLVGNALRHVRTGTRRMPGGSVNVTAVVANDRIDIAVEDDGDGIAPEMLPKLFERPAGKTHAPGFGLMLVKDVAEAHGGSFRITSCQSGDAQGTSAVISLPLTR
jgi:signal transduction histidine kinase